MLKQFSSNSDPHVLLDQWGNELGRKVIHRSGHTSKKELADDHDDLFRAPPTHMNLMLVSLKVDFVTIPEVVCERSRSDRSQVLCGHAGAGKTKFKNIFPLDFL